MCFFFFILLDVFNSINKIGLVICSVAPFPLSFCLKGISVALTGSVYQPEQKRSYQLHHSQLGFPGGSAGKESACKAGDLGLIPGLGRSPGERKGYPLQYFGLENSMDCRVHGVAKSQTRLNDFHITMPTSVNIVLMSQKLHLNIPLTGPKVNGLHLNLFMQ